MVFRVDMLDTHFKADSALVRHEGQTVLFPPLFGVVRCRMCVLSLGTLVFDEFFTIFILLFKVWASIVMAVSA